MLKSNTSSLSLSDISSLSGAISLNPGNAKVTDLEVSKFLESLEIENDNLKSTVDTLILETKFNDEKAVKSSHVLGEEPYIL